MSIQKLQAGAKKIIKTATTAASESRPIKSHPKKDTIADYFEFNFNKFEVLLKKEADIFLTDVETAVKKIKGAVFDRNTHAPNVLKSRESTMRKFYKSGEISDPIRTTIYMPDAHEHYGSLISEMDKMGYRVVLNGKYPDISVRHGETAQKSGYEDVAIKFTKKHRNHQIFREVIILPGPNYNIAKEQEHEIYEAIRRYDGLLTKNPQVLELASLIKAEAQKLSRKIYANAKLIDEKGMANKENITFSKSNVTVLKKNLAQLRKTLYEDLNQTLTGSNTKYSEFNMKNSADFNISNQATIGSNPKYTEIKIKNSADFKILNQAEKELNLLLKKYAPNE